MTAKNLRLFFAAFYANVFCNNFRDAQPDKVRDACNLDCVTSRLSQLQVIASTRVLLFCFCNWLLITFFIFHFSRKQSRVKKGKKGRRETGGGRLWGNHNSSNVAGILPTVKYIYRDICVSICAYIYDLKQFRTGRGSPSALWLPQFYCLAAKKLNTISLFISKPFLISLCKT